MLDQILTSLNEEKAKPLLLPEIYLKKSYGTLKLANETSQNCKLAIT